MNKKTIYIVSTLIIVGIASLAYYQYVLRSKDLSGIEKQTVHNESVELSFEYVPTDKGFSLIEPPVGENGLLAAYIVMPSKDYEDYKDSSESREAPAAISVLVYSLDTATTTATSGERIDRITRLQNWAIDNDILTSFSKAKATPEIVEIDGIKMLRYQADGLYQQEIYLASYKNRAYLFVGQYNSPSDITYIAFKELITSVVFE